VPDLQGSQPRCARAAAPATARAAAGRDRRRPLGRLDYAAVQDEREPPAGPPEEEGTLEDRPEGFGRQWQPRL